jgi:hypothetical protein
VYDDNSIFSHMKTATVLHKVAADPGAIRHDDTFTDDRMPNFRVSSDAHTRHQDRT